MVPFLLFYSISLTNVFSFKNMQVKYTLVYSVKFWVTSTLNEDISTFYVYVVTGHLKSAYALKRFFFACCCPYGIRHEVFSVIY